MRTRNDERTNTDNKKNDVQGQEQAIQEQGQTTNTGNYRRADNKYRQL